MRLDKHMMMNTFLPAKFHFIRFPKYSNQVWSREEEPQMVLTVAFEE